ncbi:hypothetical protein PFISCL1PPCAC_18625 [Pristionchus fissidentatus]|uniref:Uncharacterized protein n=1 Tax=Pristionchus fissidentatus TaxID=1538716 RepID=A0AAV5WA94_9BILA|nr:hypothetical protein PFISCL1PPCAC_18625 [Pristionchus fissidentatus]
MFTHYYDTNEYFFQYQTEVPFELRSSVFDLDSSRKSNFLTITKLRHSSMSSKLPEKAGQLLKLMRKLNETCVDRSIKDYHKKHFNKFADFDSLIEIIEQKC